MSEKTLRQYSEMNYDHYPLPIRSADDIANHQKSVFIGPDRRELWGYLEDMEDDMKHSREQLHKLVDAVRKVNSPGVVVCDSINKCEGWKKSMKQIEDAQVFLSTTRGIQYAGDAFRFCPWCGKPLDPARQHD